MESNVKAKTKATTKTVPEGKEEDEEATEGSNRRKQCCMKQNKIRQTAC
jgi:hypothetical protein